MPPQEQAELWMALRDRMTVDWKELTTQEKKACEYSLLYNSPADEDYGVCYVTIGAKSILAGQAGHPARGLRVGMKMRNTTQSRC